ncbi:ATP-binding protein [Streptomyces sp. NPDC059740]|uniref:ATP-binding protein n=1 Tax=Streptomyces sp. NPDC059740 TaxID=3346926 RepID=UPI00365A7338
MATPLTQSAPDLPTTVLRAGHGDPSQTFAACALGDDPRTVAEARRFTAATLSHWAVRDITTQDAELVVSELVSNALRYGTSRPGDTDGAYSAWLGLLREDDGVLCVVNDSSPREPVVRTPDYLAESGRGLHIVDRLSRSWGWTPPGASGKSVWASLSDVD